MRTRSQATRRKEPQTAEMESEATEETPGLDTAALARERRLLGVAGFAPECTYHILLLVNLD